MTGPFSGRWPRDWMWAALGPLAALVVFHGAFSAERVYFLRDLSLHLWGEHLWLRESLFRGELPLWDPYAAFGQNAVADPNRGLLFPPTLLVRVLGPPALGFNLCVALAFPVLALGTFLFLRRYVSQSGAAVGSVAFVLSGPALSMANFINFPWAFAFVPWALFASDRLAERPTPRRFALLSLFFALVFLAGESVTTLTAALLTLAHVALGSSTERGWKLRARGPLLVLGAGAAALFLVAAQALPLADVASRSLRSFETNQRVVHFWSLHPVSLLEALMPQVFGEPFAPSGASGLWVQALNGGREPLIFSVYMGVGLLALSALGALAETGLRRVAVFWLVVAALTLVLAFGSNTPIYPALERSLPELDSVRFTSKLVVTTAFALSVLAAIGWDALSKDRFGESRRWRLRAVIGATCLIGALGLAAGYFAFAAPGILDKAIRPLASYVGASDPARASAFLGATARFTGPRLFALAAATGATLWWGAARGIGRARGLLLAMIVCDLLVSNSTLVPMMNVSDLGTPEWVTVTREHPDERTYVAGRIPSTLVSPSETDSPLPPEGLPVTERPPLVEHVARLGFLASFPGGWHVRDSLSHDISLLFPREYWDMLRRFASSDREARIRFLRRAGVRYYLVPWDPFPDATVRLELLDRKPLHFFELAPEVQRATVVPAARVTPETRAQIDRLFEDDFDPSEEVLLAEAAPDPTGVESAPCPPSATLVADGVQTVSIRACAPEDGGYLLLLDSFDPSWQADVDGQSAPVLRANGLFRAVRLRPGSHLVTFSFHPKRFWIGFVVSSGTALVLLAACILQRRRTAAA